MLFHGLFVEAPDTGFQLGDVFSEGSVHAGITLLSKVRMDCTPKRDPEPHNKLKACAAR